MDKLAPPPLRTDIVKGEKAARPWQAWFNDIRSWITDLVDNQFVLKSATKTTLGGVIIGDNVNVDNTGKISVDKAIDYKLPIASGSVLGGVKIGNGISENPDGTISIDEVVQNKDHDILDNRQTLAISATDSRHDAVALWYDGDGINRYGANPYGSGQYKGYAIPGMTVDDALDELFYKTPVVASLSWSKITNTPTTISGYGITDANFEPALGLPASDGMVLSSTVAGIRSWIAQSGGIGGSGTVGYVPLFTLDGVTLGNSNLSNNKSLSIVYIENSTYPAQKLAINITSTGNVNFNATGTTLCVNNKLVVSSSTEPVLGLYSSNADTAARNWAIVANDQTWGDFAISQSNAIGGDPVAAGTRRFYISPIGNVGLGYISPLSTLCVNGGVNIGSAAAIGTDSLRLSYDNSHYSNFNIANNGAMTIGSTGNITIAPPAIFNLGINIGSNVDNTNGLQISYDSNNYTNFNVGSAGQLTISITDNTVKLPRSLLIGNTNWALQGNYYGTTHDVTDILPTDCPWGIIGADTGGNSGTDAVRFVGISASLSSSNPLSIEGVVGMDGWQVACVTIDGSQSDAYDNGEPTGLHNRKSLVTGALLNVCNNGMPMFSVRASGDLLIQGNSMSVSDWTPYAGIGGFSSVDSASKVFYKMIGKTVFLWFQIYGTSSNTYFTFVLPYKVKTFVSYPNVFTLDFPVRAIDNGSQQQDPGFVEITAGSNSVQVQKNRSTDAWTASGTKGAFGFICYEVD